MLPWLAQGIVNNILSSKKNTFAGGYFISSSFPHHPLHKSLMKSQINVGKSHNQHSHLSFSHTRVSGIPFMLIMMSAICIKKIFSVRGWRVFQRRILHQSLWIYLTFICSNSSFLISTLLLNMSILNSPKPMYSKSLLLSEYQSSIQYKLEDLYQRWCE